MRRSDIGVIGLAVMGENLVLNMENKGFHVSVFNRTYDKVESFLASRGFGKNIVGAIDLETLIGQLNQPRKVMLMIKSGSAVDVLINQLIPLLEPGDIIIDGGNTHFLDTERRQARVEEIGLQYLGVGVSGGEEGALNGPAIMVGGSVSAWQHMKPILSEIAAKVDGKPCCAWLGKGGAGHFVKMVHNGIEYGDMQIICEVYHVMKKILRMSNERMSSIFKIWNAGKLNSYLIEITSRILAFKDDEGFVLDRIRDNAGQKGTGKWASLSAIDLNVELTLIAEAVFARMLSSRIDDRKKASKRLKRLVQNSDYTEESLLEGALEDATYLAKIISYAQGFELLAKASLTYGWGLDLAEIALIWRGGCIIRSAFLNDISSSISTRGSYENLLLTPFFSEIAKNSEEALRMVIMEAVKHAIPAPSLNSALSYLDGFRMLELPMNLLQAQRDYFGAHTYERVDHPEGELYHTNWTGEGGSTTSSHYDK